MNAKEIVMLNRFLLHLKELVENIGEQDVANNTSRLKFIKIASNHLSVFVIIYQLIRKFNFGIYTLDVQTLKLAVYFEYEKMKTYMKVVNKIEKLQGQLTVLEKAFL